MEETYTIKKLASVLDGLPENRAERLVILLNNLPSEDLCHIVNDKIPAFLRIDKDVQAQRDKLTNFAKEFMDFDIEDLDTEVRQKLKELVLEASQEYFQHQEKAVQMLDLGDQTN